MKAAIFGNLKLTMESGQPPHFLWAGDGKSYQRSAKGTTITLAQKNGQITASHPEEAGVLLRQKDDLKEITARLSAGDPVIRRAAAKFSGLRLTKNDAWETTVAYLCSQNSNIKRIRANVQGMLGADGRVKPAEELAAASLKRLNLGYREPYIKQTAAMVADGEFDFEGVSKLSCQDGRAELQLLPGVGPKVADCILLYGFGRPEAFPNDVWIGRAMEKWYGTSRPKAVEEFAQKRWGPLAGYAQQYLFMLARDELAGARHK